jgi:WD40 repeat protein
VIEEICTGRQVAVLRGVTNDVRVAPGGRTAVSRNDIERHWSDDGCLTLWDLETPCCRAELQISNAAFDLWFSPEGCYVFVLAESHQKFGPTTLDWWNTQTGRRTGEITDPGEHCVVDRGRNLLKYSHKNSTLHFWDVATGEEVDEWQPMLPPNSHQDRSLRRGNDRTVVLTYYPGSGGSAGKASPIIEKVSDWLADRVSKNTEHKDRRRVVVLDVIDRRVVGDVPGVSAVVSENDRYLASIDADGVVRVWELPLRRPWLRGFVYSAALIVGSWLVLTMLGKLRRRFWPPHVD